MKYEFALQSSDGSPVHVVVETRPSGEAGEYLSSIVEFIDYTDSYEYDKSMFEFGEEPSDPLMLLSALNFYNQAKIEICIRDRELGLWERGYIYHHLSRTARTVLALSMAEPSRYEIARAMTSPTSFSEEQQLMILSSLSTNLMTMALVDNLHISYGVFLAVLKTLPENDQIQVISLANMKRFNVSTVLEIAKQVGLDEVSYIIAKQLSSTGLGFMDSGPAQRIEFSISAIELIKDEEKRLIAVIAVLNNVSFKLKPLKLKPKQSERISELLLHIDKKLIKEYCNSISAVSQILNDKDFSRVASLIARCRHMP